MRKWNSGGAIVVVVVVVVAVVVAGVWLEIEKFSAFNGQTRAIIRALRRGPSSVQTNDRFLTAREILLRRD